LIISTVSFSAAIIAKIRSSMPKISLGKEKIGEKFKRASDLTPCPLKFCEVDKSLKLKNLNKFMKKNSAIQLCNSSGRKHPYPFLNI